MTLWKERISGGIVIDKVLLSKIPADLAKYYKNLCIDNQRLVISVQRKVLLFGIRQLGPVGSLELAISIARFSTRIRIEHFLMTVPVRNRSVVIQYMKEKDWLLSPDDYDREYLGEFTN